MGLFNRKGKAYKDIYDGAWGHLISDHHIDVDTLSNDLRCVDKPGAINGEPVKLLRVFSLSQLSSRAVAVTGWETFDEHPELLLFEGYLDWKNHAYLARKKPAK